MKPSGLLNILFGEEAKNFFISYAATETLDVILEHFRDKESKHDLSWQLLDSLSKAHELTCDELHWEYDSDSFLTSYVNFIFQSHNILSTDILAGVFSQVIGYPVNNEEIERWISNFVKQLVKREHVELREYIKLQTMKTGEKSNDIKRAYLRRFKEERFTIGDIWFKLSDLYLPNNYKINGEGPAYDDLLEIVNSYMRGNIDSYLLNKGIQLYYSPNILFVIAYQCTGKSTLISKILYDIPYEEYIFSPRIFVVSFSEKSMKDKGLDINEICKYLDIRREELTDAVLFIDGLDDSNYSSSKAIDALEDLIDDSQELNCRIIVMSRPISMFSDTLKGSLAIHLQPFSFDQAIKWVDQYSEIINTTEITEQIRSLSPSVKEVILIPYILYFCILHNIEINKISELAKLYDLLFFTEKAALFTPYNYNQHRRIKTRVWSIYVNIITELSIEYFKSTDSTVQNDRISELIGNQELDEDHEYGKITSEFFLSYRDKNSFSFVHDSVPHFFIAKFLYDSFLLNLITIEDAIPEYKKLVNNILFVTGNNIHIPVAITDFIEYFVRSNNIDYNKSILFLKAFLKDDLSSFLTIKGNLTDTQNYYYNFFINIVRLVIAFVRPNIKPFSTFDLFDKLTGDELDRFILLSRLGNANLDCLSICKFKSVTLDGINLSTTNLFGKSLSYSMMRNSVFNSAQISGAYIINADLSLSNFDGAHCSNADFTNCILFGCSFKGANLQGANFTGCIMAYVDLRGAKLKKAQFWGADLRKAKISVEQMHDIFEFDLSFIKRNNIEVYLGNEIISNEYLEEEYKRQRPVSYSLHKISWENK